MKTSIVIYKYKELRDTIECVDNINSYTREGSYEIIVLVDDTMDNNIEIWLRKQKNVKIVCYRDNFASSINLAINKCGKDNDILLLRNDIVVTKNWLDNLKQALYSNIDIGAVGPVTNDFRAQSIKVNYTNINEMQVFAENFNKYNKMNHEYRLKLFHLCILIKRNVIDTVGSIDEQFTLESFTNEDYCYSILKNNFKLLLCRDTFVHNRQEDYCHTEDSTQEIKINKNNIEEKWNIKFEYSTGLRRDLINLIDVNNDKAIRILEVGCGCGVTLAHLKNIYKNAEVHGIEIDKNCCEIAKAYAKILNGNIEEMDLPYEKEYFDIIICGDVLEHLISPEKAINKLRKILKLSGVILASIPNVGHYSIIRELLNGNWTYTDSGLLDRTHIRFFTLKEIEKLFRKCEFTNIQITSNRLNCNEEDCDFIDKILCINDSIEEQLYAYQYLIKAKKQ